MVEFVIALYCLCSCERSLHWWTMKFEGGLKNIVKLTGAYKPFSSPFRVKYSGRIHNCLLDKSWLILILSLLDRNFNWLSSSEMNRRIEFVELTTEFTLALLTYVALCSLICSLKTILKLLCFSNSKYRWHYD